MIIHVTLRPGVSPMDRGTLEDMVCDAILTQTGVEAGCVGGGSLLGDGAIEESDFDLELQGCEPDAVSAICVQVLGGVSFTIKTHVTVCVDQGPVVELDAGGE